MGFSTKYVEFGGTDEFVTAGDVLDFTQADSFSVSFWVKAPELGGPFPIISKTGGPSPQGWAVFLDGTRHVSFRLVYSYAPDNWYGVDVTEAGFSFGDWHHVVVTYNGAGTTVIYVDGVAKTTSVINNTLSTSITNAYALTLGRMYNSGIPFYLTSDLDEVSVYNKVLTPTEVTWIYNAGETRDLLAEGSPGSLVAWWRMGEGDTFPTLGDDAAGKNPYPTIRDYSVGGNDGTMTNMESSDLVADVPGGSEKSVRFDGVNERGDVWGQGISSPSYMTIWYDWSISVWFKTTSANNGMIIGSGGGATAYQGWTTDIAPDGSVRFELRKNVGTSDYLEVKTTRTDLADGGWHHLVITHILEDYDATHLTAYVDGQPETLVVAQNSLVTDYATASEPRCGYFDARYGSTYFAGQITHIAFWNKVLSAAEAAWVYNNGTPPDLTGVGAPSSLMDWFPMGTGGSDAFPILYDYGPGSTPANYIELINCEATDILDDAPYGDGLSKRSLLFGGTDEYVTMGNVLDFDTTDPFSLSGWFKSTVLGTHYLVTKMVPGGSATGWTLSIGPNRMVVEFANGGTLFNNLQANLPAGETTDGTWHHFAMTWDGNASVPTSDGYNLYWDGVPYVLVVNQNDLGSASITNSGELELGAIYTWGFNLLNGGLDEVAVHDKELSSVEVTWIYNSGVPRDLLDGAAPSNLVGWWRTEYDLLYDGTMSNMEAGDIKDFTVVIDAAASLLGDASLAALGLVRKPRAPVIQASSVVVPQERLVGLQLGRAPAHKEPVYTVNPTPPRRRG